MAVSILLAVVLAPGLQGQYRAGEARLAKATGLSVYVKDHINGVETLMQFQKPDKYRLQSTDGTGFASDGNHTYRRLNSFGWYEDFKSDEAIPRDLQPPGFTSFFEGRPSYGELLDGNPHPSDGSEPYFEVKTSEAAFFYATVQWSRKTFMPIGSDAWEKDVHASHTSYSELKLNPAFPKGTFTPRLSG